MQIRIGLDIVLSEDDEEGVANVFWKIFGDKHVTIEDLMRERGQLVKKGTLSEDGDLEFWEDGSTTARVKSVAATAEGRGAQQPKALE